MSSSTVSPYIQAAAGASRPWNSVDATVEDLRTERMSSLFTNQREIDICLNCPLPECCNCVEAWKNAFGNVRKHYHKKGKPK